MKMMRRKKAKEKMRNKMMIWGEII